MKGTSEELELERLLPKTSNGDKQQYSVIRARIIAAFIPVFVLSSSGSRDSLLTQYIVKKLGDDIGLSNITKTSACTESGNSSDTQAGDDPQAQDIAVNIRIFQLIVGFLARLRTVVCHCFLRDRLTYPVNYQRGENSYQFSRRLRSSRGYTGLGRKTSTPRSVRPAYLDLAGLIYAKSGASELLSYFVLAQTIPGFVACLLLGSYTDYVGRRLLLLLPVFTYFVRTLFICFVVKFHLDLNYIYLAYGIDGLTGSSYAILLALYAFTADLSSSSKNRTFWIYSVSCTSSTISAVINITSGYLIKKYGFFEAALFLSAMNCVGFIVPLIFLPETLQQRRSVKGVSPLTHLRIICGFYFLDGPLRRRVTFCMCLSIFVIGIANDLHLSSIDSLYQMHYPFCWDSVQIGNYSAIRTAGGHILALVLYKLLQMCMAIEQIGMLGVAFHAGAFVVEAFIQESWQFYLVPVIQIPSCLTTAVVRTMFSILAGPDHQGAVFSSIAVVETLCSLATSQIYNRIYSATVAFMPGAVYLVMASISCVTFILFGVYFKVRERPQQMQIISDDNLAEKENILNSNSFSSNTTAG